MHQEPQISPAPEETPLSTHEILPEDEDISATFSIISPLSCAQSILGERDYETLVAFLQEKYQPSLTVMLKAIMHVPWIKLKAAIGLCLHADVFRMSAVAGYDRMGPMNEDAKEILLHTILHSKLYPPAQVIEAIYQRLSMVRILAPCFHESSAFAVPDVPTSTTGAPAAAAHHEIPAASCSLKEKLAHIFSRH